MRAKTITAKGRALAAELTTDPRERERIALHCSAICSAAHAYNRIAEEIETGAHPLTGRAELERITLRLERKLDKARGRIKDALRQIGYVGLILTEKASFPSLALVDIAKNTRTPLSM